MVDLLLIFISINVLSCSALLLGLILSEKKFKYFILFNLSLLLWNIFYGLSIKTESAEASLWYNHFCFFFGTFVSYLAFNFSVGLCKVKISKKIRVINTTLVLLFAALMFTPNMIKGVKPFMEFNFIPKIGWMYYIFILYYFSNAIAAHVILYKNLKYNPNNKLIFLGFIIGFTGGSTAILPYFGIPVYPLAMITMSIYCPVIIYLIIRKVKIYLADDVKILNYNVLFIAVIGSLSHVFYWFWWTQVRPQENEDTTMRIIGIVSCLLLLTTKYWPKKIHNFFPIYWFFVLFYNLSFFFTVYLISSNFSPFWTTSYISMVFTSIMLIPNYIILFANLFIGLIAAIMYCKIFIPELLVFDYEVIIFSYFPSLMFAFGAGLIFSYSNSKGIAVSTKTRLLKSLAGSIAHELRNPLGSIRLATENLDANSDSSQITNFKRQINKTVDLAGDIIDITLHELGGKKFSKDDFTYYTAHKAVNDAVTIYGYDNNEEKERVFIDFGNGDKIKASNADKRKISVSDIDKSDNFIIHINDTAFKYIIFNLIKNALFYLKEYPKSNITIDFEQEKVIDQDLKDKFKLSPDIVSYNVVNVVDTGPGISDEIITKIFDSYFTSGKKGGTGVGLDFCARVMHDFGGAITCESELGKYTKFSLLFPILKDEEVKAGIKHVMAIETAKKEAKAGGKNISEVEKRFNGSTKHILLLDDVDLNIKLLSKALSKRCPNFNLVLETDPNKALTLVEERQKSGKQFDLIVTDYEMPDVNGFAVINHVRNKLNITKDDLPILLYTSREDEELIKEAKNIGANGFYVKGKDVRFLARNMSKWVLHDYVPNFNINNEAIVINDKTLGDKNIIIADDNLINLTAVCRSFSKVGANIIKCGDGDEVIKHFEEQEPNYFDLIVTDINMDRIGGIELTKTIRDIENTYNQEHQTNFRIPIISLSGESDKESIFDVLNNDLDDVFIKGKTTKDDMIKLSKFWIDYRFIKQINISKQSPKGDIINKKHFEQCFEDKDSAQNIIETFKEETQAIIQEIVGNKEDPKELFALTHKLKGASSSIGANKLYNYLIEINKYLKKGKTTQDKDFKTKIKKLLNEACQELEKSPNSL